MGGLPRSWSTPSLGPGLRRGLKPPLVQQAAFDELIFRVDVMRNVATRTSDPSAAAVTAAEEDDRVEDRHVTRCNSLPAIRLNGSHSEDELEEVAGRLEIRVVPKDPATTETAAAPATTTTTTITTTTTHQVNGATKQQEQPLPVHRPPLNHNHLPQEQERASKESITETTVLKQEVTNEPDPEVVCKEAEEIIECEVSENQKEKPPNLPPGLEQIHCILNVEKYEIRNKLEDSKEVENKDKEAEEQPEEKEEVKEEVQEEKEEEEEKKETCDLNVNASASRVLETNLTSQPIHSNNSGTAPDIRPPSPLSEPPVGPPAPSRDRRSIHNGLSPLVDDHSEYFDATEHPLRSASKGPNSQQQQQQQQGPKEDSEDSGVDNASQILRESSASPGPGLPSRIPVAQTGGQRLAKCLSWSGAPGAQELTPALRRRRLGEKYVTDPRELNLRFKRHSTAGPGRVRGVPTTLLGPGAAGAESSPESSEGPPPPPPPAGAPPPEAAARCRRFRPLNT